VRGLVLIEIGHLFTLGKGKNLAVGSLRGEVE